ncbi:hypothetical protein YPPY48_3597, partial [Yersinia pestis PY-48]
MPGFGHYRRST